MIRVPSAASAADPPPLPLPSCYWVFPGQLLAGEHPGGLSREETRNRLTRLLGAGVECFVDLTYPTELARYDTELPLNVEYLRKPIKDHGLPEQPGHMREILDCIHGALASGRKVYVHCRAGIGRTGTVIGCLLAEKGFAGEAALDELNRVWQQSERSKSWDWVPETKEQIAYVRAWATPQPADEAVPRRVADRSRLKPTLDAPAPERSDPLLEDSTLSAARGLRSRFLGAFLGLAVGDALAAATQYRRPGTFAPVGDLLGGGPFDLPRGGWSDDTAMALCLADSLLECGGFDAHDQVDRYTRWQRDGYLSATGQCLGITASTARALAVAQWRRQAFSGSHDPSQLDPETLSRVGATTMFYFASAAEASQQASESARPTCQAPSVLEACRSLSRLLHAALSGQSKAAILALAPPLATAGSGAAESTAAAPVAASAGEVLGAAVWAFSSTGNFRDAVLRSVNLGGNSDVIAAVCGQLAGAHYMVAGIPAAWRKSLIHKDLIEGLADRLLAHAMLGLGGQ